MKRQSVNFGVDFATGNETKLVQLCTLLMHVATDPRIPRAVGPTDFRVSLTGCIEYGATEYRFWHMYLHPRPRILLHPKMVELDKFSFPPPASIRSLREKAASSILDARTTPHCSRIGCENTIQSAGKSFQRCARCSIAPYCGRECQTFAWKEEEYPHKRICPKVRLLVSSAGGIEALQKGMDVIRLGNSFQLAGGFAEKWAEANVSEEDMQYVEEWWNAVLQPRNNLPDGTQWHPGFDDYDCMVTQFGADGKGPKGWYLFLSIEQCGNPLLVFLNSHSCKPVSPMAIRSCEAQGSLGSPAILE